jgi:hypothetical protein
MTNAISRKEQTTKINYHTYTRGESIILIKDERNFQLVFDKHYIHPVGDRGSTVVKMLRYK